MRFSYQKNPFSSLNSNDPFPLDISLSYLVSFVEEHFPEDVVVDLHPGNSGRRLATALANHDSMSSGDLGLLLSHIKGDGVDKGLWVDLVVVHGTSVPDLVSRLVVDACEMPASRVLGLNYVHIIMA